MCVCNYVCVCINRVIRKILVVCRFYRKQSNVIYIDDSSIKYS